MWVTPWDEVRPVEKQQSCIILEGEGVRCLSKQVREVLEKSLTGRGRKGSDSTGRARRRPRGWI